MGKRSDFVKRPQDQYLTPSAAVAPLVPFLPKTPFGFTEPCAGDGRLVKHLELMSAGICCHASELTPDHPDLQPPQVGGIVEMDALDLAQTEVRNSRLIITNPPWTRTKASGYLLHEMIVRFSDLRPTWLLFDADWMHTKQATPYIRDRLLSVVSIGRVKWIEDSKSTGKDNCAWYLFDKDARETQTHPEFFGRGITI